MNKSGFSNYRAIHKERFFHGRKILKNEEGYVKSYLYRLEDVLMRALDAHPRTFAFRVDFHEPDDLDIRRRQRLMESMVASFRYRIDNRVKRLKEKDIYYPSSDVRHVWARERSSNGLVHYHCLFLLNKDAFGFLGTYQQGRDNIFNDLGLSWASALGVPAGQGFDKMHVPKNATYIINKNGSGMEEAFERFSYLAKVATKHRDGFHAFGASRI